MENAKGLPKKEQRVAYQYQSRPAAGRAFRFTHTIVLDEGIDEFGDVINGSRELTFVEVEVSPGCWELLFQVVDDPCIDWAVQYLHDLRLVLRRPKPATPEVNDLRERIADEYAAWRQAMDARE